ncbi:MAG TPA: twin-arginine translocation signal domain-containing protein [Acidimicrobiales bacterium]|nr:twin-arginine translocation signal domain-containing protein [Acidimicrobiales bacterium]
MRTNVERPSRTGDDVGRRDFLRKAAVVGTGAFVVPTIVTVDPADAQAVTSPPPQPPGQAQPGAPADVRGPQPGVAAGKQPPKPQDAGGGELALTGMDLDKLAVAGLAATAGGAALLLWSADAAASAPRPADPHAET